MPEGTYVRPALRSEMEDSYAIQSITSPKKGPITFGIFFMVAVGTQVALRPPHRSQRALLTHWAPTSGSNVQAQVRIRMTNS